MKTTVDLPDELLRTVKIRAASQNRTLKDVIAELLRRGLADESAPEHGVRARVQLPLVECAHHARPEEEATPERVARLLAADDVRGLGS